MQNEKLILAGDVGYTKTTLVPFQCYNNRLIELKTFDLRLLQT